MLAVTTCRSAAQLLWRPGPLLFTLCWCLTAQAQALDIRNEEEVSASNVAMIRAAFDLLLDHEYLVENEISDALGRCGPSSSYGNPDHGYECISERRMERWHGEVDKMIAGNIGIIGHQDESDRRRCHNEEDDRTISFTGDFLGWDDVVLCLGNLRRVADGVPTSPEAVTASAIAHELMHHVDGLQGHDRDGTDPSDPETSAETIGAAMENILVRAELSIRIDDGTAIPGLVGAASRQSVAERLRLSLTVENLNPRAQPNFVSLAGQGARETTICITDGNGLAMTDPLTVVPVDPASPEVFEATFDITGIQRETLTAKVDCEDVISETEEWNNTDQYHLDRRPDLTMAIVDSEHHEADVLVEGDGAQQGYLDAVTVRIENQGISSSAPSHVDILAEDYETVGSAAVPAMDAGTEFEVRIQTPNTRFSGPRTFTAIVDRWQREDESDEGNNEDTVTMPFSNAPLATKDFDSSSLADLLGNGEEGEVTGTGLPILDQLDPE